MAKTINKELTPDEVEEVVQTYLDKLKTTGLAYKEEKIREDVKKRVADLNSMTVADWEAKWEEKKAAIAPPAPATPRKTRAEKAAEEEAVKKTTQERVERIREVTQSTDGSYFFINDDDRRKMELWMKMRREGGIVQNMLITGPSGAGKTESIKKIAEENDLPFYKVDCASITTPDKWVGHKEVNEKGTYYVLSEHLRWLSADGFEPGIVVYDELTRLHPSLLNILIPILDGSQSIWVPDLGIYVPVHRDTIIAATANVGSEFSGTYGLDLAIWERFAVTQERSWPPAKEEVKILEKRTGISTDNATKLVEIAAQVRAKFDQGQVSRPLSTRNLIDCGYWVAAGMSIIEASETTWVKKYSAEGKGTSERATVQLILQGKAGGKA